MMTTPKSPNTPPMDGTMRGGMLEKGFWHGLMMGMGAVGYLGHTPAPPPRYPKNASLQDLQMIGGDMYSGWRAFNEKAKKQTAAS